MKIPTKNLSSNFEIPVFGLGTYSMGESNSRQEKKLIQQAIQRGICHIDTAESYANGNCEKLIGEAITPFDRKSLFLTSKIHEKNLSYKGIISALQNSLERMRTNYLDLYLMHRCPPEEKFPECIEAMSELVAAGLVRHVGLSNTNTLHTKMLQQMSGGIFAVNQSHYNLQFREAEADGLVTYCQKNDMMFVAWRPLNKGNRTKTGTDLTKNMPGVLQTMCEKYGKTPAQISINWLISQKNVVTIVKTGSLSHLDEDMGSIFWQMEPNDIELLRIQFTDQHLVSDTVPLS